VSEEHKESRRQSILDAAQAVFIEKGGQLATIDDIASRSGLSVGALYRYFPTKSDIMLTLLEDRLGRTPEVFRRLTGDAPSAWQRLALCVDVFVRALRLRHPHTGRLLLVVWGVALQERAVRLGLQQRFEDLMGYMVSVIREGVASGEFRTDVDPEAIASVLVALADGVTLSLSVGTPGVEVRRMRSTVLALLRTHLMPSTGGEG
jgi:AcrR family transcriptional regulator